MNFYHELFSRLEKNIYNDFEDNWDYFSLGPRISKPSVLDKLDVRMVLKRLTERSAHIEKYKEVFHFLEDSVSKSLYVDLLAYRILGGARYKLPLSTPRYFTAIEALEKERVDKKDSIDVEWLNGEYRPLYKTSVSLPSGGESSFYYSAGGLYTLFCLGQYRFSRGDTTIMPEEGDTVIDAGGCWGDSAILFADLVGETGHVFTFECLPQNIEVFKTNMKMAGMLSTRVSLYERALWSDTDQELDILAEGPGSRRASEQEENAAIKVRTLSVDKLMEQEKLSNIDFIKMDIEGAELEALKGAEGCLRKCRPKLAISIYHNRGQDMIDVPLWLSQLDIGYKFYVDHYSILQWETVLYATVE